MTSLLRALSTSAWKQILEILGTGDFHRIEFRPPSNDNEALICKIAAKDDSGGTGLSSWWICEADYMECVSEPDGGIIGCDVVTRKFAFCLHVYDDPVE